MQLQGRTRDLLRRYGVAVALPALSVVLRAALPIPEGAGIYQLPLAAVVLSAWYGGRRPGLLACAISIAGAMYLLPPAYSFKVAADHALPLSIFAVLCLFLSEFAAGRRRAGQALRDSEERFRTLADFSFDVYWEADANHRFTRMHFSERLTDAPPAAGAIGKTPWEIPYVEPDDEGWRKYRAMVEARVPYRDFEMARPTADGGIRYLSVSALPMFDEDGRFLGYRGVGRHITERKRIEALLAGEKSTLEMLARGDPLPSVLESLCRLVEQEVPGALASVLLVEGNRLRHGSAPSLPKEYTQAIDGLLIGPAEGSCGAAAFRGEPVVARDIESDPLWEGHRGLALAHGLRACWSMPIFSAERKVIGTLAMYYREARAPSAADQEAAERLSYLAGVSIQSRLSADALRESEARFRKLSDLSADWYWKQDENLRFTVSMDEKVGFAPLSLGKTRWELPLTPLSGSWDEHRAVLEARKPFRNFEYSRVDENGVTRYISVSGFPVFDDQGVFKGYDGVASDITSRRAAEQELRESERRLEAAQGLAHVGWWERDYASGRVSLSDEACRIFGVLPVELPHWHGRWLSLIHPDDRQKAGEASDKALRGEARYDVEYRVVRPDGTVRMVHSQGDVTRDDAGRAVRQFGVLQDITDLRQAEQELRARQEMLDLAQKAARAVAFDWYIGERENENQWSPELEKMYGLEPGTFDRTYKGWRKLIHPDDWPSVKLAIERANATGEVDAEFRVMHKYGTVRWLQAKGRMFFHADGRPDRMVGFMMDVSDRRNAEEQLRASEARFRMFVDHATDGFFLLDDQLRIVDVNRQACEALGYSRNELITMRPSDFDAGLDAAAMRGLADRVRSGQTVTFETRHRRKDGTVFPVEIRVRQFQLGDRAFHLSLVRDISERKRTEEKLRQKDDALQGARAELAHVSRLTTLGELTTSIAHEVSQPLGAMIASAAAGERWLANKPPDLAEARSALRNIAADGKRAREVVARIRALAKRQTQRSERLDINEKILQVIALTEHERRGHDVVLRTNLDRTLPQVAGDRVQLQQVLLNLILNAVDAMSVVRGRPRELTIASGPDGKNGLLVEVLDSGVGLDAARAETVFEAFYTTKPEGIGIGLSISRAIVEAHGGRLWAAPNQPHGAAFRFSLPVAGPEQS